MAGSLFERTLATAEMEAVFADASLLGAMLAFEAALAGAEADAGVVPEAAAKSIAAACRVEHFDIEAIVAEARRAGSIAIPLVRHLTARVAAADAAAAAFVHRGSTSQDVIDTAMVLATQRAVALIEADLDRLVASLFALARQHAATPMLARTLMQPAQVISFGFKVVAWLAPLVRARERLARAAASALQLQFGGAVGTLGALDGHGADIARRLGERLGLPVPAAAWHVQRDAWVALGSEVALLGGSLGKIGHDLALLAQGEVGEAAEAHQAGRGGSSAMPNKRNPVAALIAIAAAARTPLLHAALLAAMPQEHERSLGLWQAELAAWPALFLAAHGSLRALADIAPELGIDAVRMRANIDAQRGAVFAESAVSLLAESIGKTRAHDLLARLAAESAAEGTHLEALVRREVGADAALAALDRARIATAFDVDAAARRAGVLAVAQLDALQRNEEGTST